MTLDDLETLAMQHKPLPEYTPLPDTCYYWSMRCLHDNLRDGKVTRDAAKAEKLRIVHRYREYKALYDDGCALYKERQRCIRLCETMMNDIVKETDIRKISAMACEVIGIITGDAVFVKVMREKEVHP